MGSLSSQVGRQLIGLLDFCAAPSLVFYLFFGQVVDNAGGHGKAEATR